MKKSTIWLITVVLVIAFIGLMVMQMTYLNVIVETREEQFDSTVRRSLFRVKRQLEAREAEVDPFVNFQRQGQLMLGGNVNLPNIIRKPLLERMSVDDFRIFFEDALRDMGIDSLAYEFCLVDRDGTLVYRTQGYKQAEESPNQTVYQQMLFSQDLEFLGQLQTRSAYVEVFFPSRRSYLVRSGLHYMVPSFIFSAVILFLFIFVIVVVFRSKRLSEMKNDFINNMTHEFKTPIASISLASQMLNDPSVSKSPEMVKHITGVIADETKRLRFQVEKVLQMSMFDRQKTNLKLQEVPVNAVVENAAATFELRVQKAGGEIETHLDAEDDLCMIDEMHFSNVVFNLMDNAMKYAEPERPIHLILSSRNPDDKHVELRIADNGIGIKSADLKRIFQKFYRVPTGNLHNVKGFGLGLAYVWKIINDHGGSIRAESTFGKGTTFIITMPLMA